MEFYEYGNLLTSRETSLLRWTWAKMVATSILAGKHPNFHLREMRNLEDRDILVVDCINTNIATRNNAGINPRERLALIFSPHGIPDVRPLRKCFPNDLLHLNGVPDAEAESLCLYNEPIDSIKRHWTPYTFLNRILWWLEKSAENALHLEKQELEIPYFNSSIKILFPAFFFQNIYDSESYITLQAISDAKQNPAFFTAVTAQPNSDKNHEVLIITYPPIVHRRTTSLPMTLGGLATELEIHGIDLQQELSNKIRPKFQDGKYIKDKPKKICIIINIPIIRSEGGQPEKFVQKGFFMIEPDTDIANLAVSLGIASQDIQNPTRFVPMLQPTMANEQWKSYEIAYAEIKERLSPQQAQTQNALKEENCAFHAILAGVGSLGSFLAHIWAKERWGQWTIVDPDVIEPHNVSRHIARDRDVGRTKARLVSEICDDAYFANNKTEYIESGLFNLQSDEHKEQLDKKMTSVDLIVDASTTLDVPRQLALISEIHRSSSVFLTPSGESSVLLMEDANRAIRLDALEAQYYTCLINHPIGTTHLHGNQGSLWVGAGCRDRSLIIPYDDITLHGSILATQIKMAYLKEESCIKIWNKDPETSTVTLVESPTSETYEYNVGQWTIVSNHTISKKIDQLRKEKLPNETGGIILGYIDQQSKKIYLVEVSAAPPDSIESVTSFTRGHEGLIELVKETERRTANIVSYIGDWHSHPKNSQADPSCTDINLVEQMTEKFLDEDMPYLMIIVGEEEICFCIKDDSCFCTEKVKK